MPWGLQRGDTGPRNASMDVSDTGYLGWAKTHSRARFELTGSGVPAARLEDFDEAAPALDLEIRGAYGDPELIEAIAGLRGVPPEWVLPLPGASTANFVALACVASAGDRVLIEEPVYEPLMRAVRFLGLRCSFFRRLADRGHRPDLKAVARGLTGGARAVVLTNLHNPSGLICPAEDLGRLGALTAEHSASLVVDEVYLDYATLNCGYSRTSAAALGHHVWVTDSLTKVYGLAGLRAGWIIAHPDNVRRARVIVDLLNVVDPVVSTRIATRALAGLERLGRRCRDLYRAGYPICASWLEGRSDLTGYGDNGALFGWLGLPAGVRAGELAGLLAAEYEINIVPGAFFGRDDHVRLGFGLPPAALSEGLSRVGAGIDRLRDQMRCSPDGSGFSR